MYEGLATGKLQQMIDSDWMENFILHHWKKKSVVCDLLQPKNYKATDLVQDFLTLEPSQYHKSGRTS